MSELTINNVSIKDFEKEFEEVKGLLRFIDINIDHQRDTFIDNTSNIDIITTIRQIKQQLEKAKNLI